MKIQLICVGKTTFKYLLEGEKEYLKRLQHYIQVEKIEIPELRNAKKMSKDEIKRKEGKIIIDKITNADFVVLLDEKGKQYSSKEFSKLIQKKMNLGIKRIAFVTGGAYGFSEEVYQKANSLFSLSKMTFSHQMVRMFFLEQLYRAFTILKGQPYHHE